MKAVLFDLDGTLLNTLEDLADSMNAVLQRNRYPSHPVDAYRYFVGDGIRRLVERTLPPEAVAAGRVADCVAQMRRQYAEHWADKTRPYDGIPELLDALTERGLRLTILSNKPDAATQEVVGHFLGRWSFAAVFGAREGLPIKPDPTAALEICGRLDLPPEQVLYVGDTGTDMRTAANAHMPAVGVLWGFRDEDELLANGAGAVIRHPLELLKHL